MSSKQRIGSGSRVIMETVETPQSRLVSSTMLVDLRKTPRFDTGFSGEAINWAGDRVEVTISNLSLSGLRFDLPGQALAVLMPSVVFPEDLHDPAALSLSFAVHGLTDHWGDVAVRCESVYVRRGDRGDCQVGVQFKKFEEGRATLAAYIAFREASQ